MKKILFIITFCCAALAAAQAQPARPKLVVGLVVDQMRWDYLYRYQDRYTEGGFKRLLREGFSCENCLIPYVPAITAIGHTSIYTGSVPSIHGIAGNTFMQDGKFVYCCSDSTVRPVGSNSKAGLMSPRNMWTTTIGDELRIATNDRSKVVGVAIKDRASILPAGHHANGAYWFDPQTGKFITSDFYMQALPKWVDDFNKQKLAKQYLSEPWNTLYPRDTYRQSTADNSPYEDEVQKGVSPTLPLDLPSLYKQYGYGILRSTPFGNSLTIDMAMAAIDGEQLGRGEETDFLAVSCSCTDIIGHQVGPNAVEIEDTYLRLDKSFAALFDYLDQKVGKGQYLVFLSADHGGMNNTLYLQDRRIPSDYVSNRELAKELNQLLQAKYPGADKLVQGVLNYQVFFDRKAVQRLGLDYEAVKDAVVKYLQQDKRVLYACDMDKASVSTIPDKIKSRIINGYNRERSGDVQIVLRPAYYDHGVKGTGHGAWNPYDTHIPLVFMGWNIKHGASTKPCYMTDIAPTICALLHIQAPNGCIGEPIF